MADMTLLQAIAFLEGIPKKVSKTGEEVMKEEFGKDRPYATGETYASIKGEVISPSLVFIGASTKGAYYVQKGRKEVVPKQAKILHWKDHGRDVFAMRSRAVKPDDYVGRTAKRLKSMDFH